MHLSTLIEATDVSVYAQGNTLLKNINLTIHRKETVTIIGPNGAGKTTLLKVLLGLTRCNSGNITRAPDINIGYMPQRLQLNCQLPLTVMKFLLLALNNRADSPLALKLI